MSEKPYNLQPSVSRQLSGAVRIPKGFTLIELLIVIAIIGLISTIAGVAISGARAKSRDNKRVNDMRQIQKALELAYGQGAGYPIEVGVSLGDPTHAALCGKDATVAFVADTSLANCDADKIYMGTIPRYPSPPAGVDFTYSSDGTTYCIEAELEQELPSLVLTAGPIIADHTALKNGTCP